MFSLVILVKLDRQHVVVSIGISVKLDMQQNTLSFFISVMCLSSRTCKRWYFVY